MPNRTKTQRLANKTTLVLCFFFGSPKLLLKRASQNGLRDPFVFDDGEERWLFYAAAGEFALGVTRLPDPS